MAPHPAVVAAQKAALDKARGDKPKTAADNRQEIKDQASAALAKLGLSTPSPRNSGYDGSLNEPGATPPSSSITERIARLRRSLSDEKVKNQSSSKFSLQRVKDRVQEGYADLSDGYGTLRADKVRSSAEQAEYDLDRANNRRMRRADRRQKRQEEEETKDQVKSTPTSGYVSMHSKDDAPSPPTKLGQAKEKLLRTGSLFASTMTRAAKELKEKAKKAAGRSPTEKVDERACSGGGRVAASTYVQRAHLQYDTLSTEAVTGRLQAQNTLRGDGGLWALKARYVAATKAVPGQLRAARDAEDHASRLADTLAQANERYEALKTQENLLRALVEEARRLASTEKPSNGLLAAFPAGAPPPAALGSPASSRSPASVGSPAASRSRASSAASEAAAEPAAEPAAAEEPPPAPEAGDEAEDPAVEAAAAQWCAPAVAAEPLPPPAPEPAAEGAMPSWMAPEEEAPSSTPVVEPAEAADDAAPVTPDEEDSPAFTDDDEDK